MKGSAAKGMVVIMKPEKFEITKERDEKQGFTRFYVVGRVNSKTSPALQNRLENALKSEEVNIVLNMAQVEYLSSDGIRTILNTYKQAEKADGKFRVEAPSQMVKNVLGAVALNSMFM